MKRFAAYLIGSVFNRLSKAIYKLRIVVQIFTKRHDLI